MTEARTYDMRSRSASAEATRRRIADAAQDLFLSRWYDDVTLADIAEHAGVSGQTVINHFGGKEQVFGVVIQRAGEEIQLRRYTATPGDVAGAIAALIDDYEVTGDAVVRLLAVEERLPAAQPAMARGRAEHRAWIETMFAAPAATSALLVVTDVYAWKLLRRDQGMSRDDTEAAMRRMVEAVLECPPAHDHDTGRRSA